MITNNKNLKEKAEQNDHQSIVAMLYFLEHNTFSPDVLSAALAVENNDCKERWFVHLLFHKIKQIKRSFPVPLSVLCSAEVGIILYLLLNGLNMKNKLNN